MKHLAIVLLPLLILLTSCPHNQKKWIAEQEDNTLIANTKADTIEVIDIIEEEPIIEMFAEMLPLVPHKDETLDWHVADSSANNHLIIVGDTLIALQKYNENSDDTANKYGYEFTSHCYSCQAIDLLVSPHTLALVGGCAEYGYKEYSSEYEMIGKGENKYVVRMKDGIEFVFEQVADAPLVFKLTIYGSIEKDEYGAPYFSKYYTTRTALPQFTIFDCGDFQG